MPCLSFWWLSGEGDAAAAGGGAPGLLAGGPLYLGSGSWQNLHRKRCGLLLRPLCAQEEGISSPSGKWPQVASSGGSPAPLEDRLPIPSLASSGTSALLSLVGNLFLWRFCWSLPLYQQAGSAFHLEAIFFFFFFNTSVTEMNWTESRIVVSRKKKVKMHMILSQTLCICHLHPINGLWSTGK